MGNVIAVLDLGYEQTRPSTAPAYYLGRPAHLWIAVMRHARKVTATRPRRDLIS